MKFSKVRIIQVTATLLFLVCMFLANFLTVRVMLRYGVDAYFYDKLLVAYDIGGKGGLKEELGKIPVTGKSSRESVLAKDFNSRFAGLGNPELFLSQKVQESKQKIILMRNLRNAAVGVIFILFIWQLIVGFLARAGLKKPS